MPSQKVVQAQRDFSGGECDPWIKRADDQPVLKSAMRQARNWRVLQSRGLANRPGRRILMLEPAARVEEIIMNPTNSFYLVFGNLYLRVYNAALTKVFDSGLTVPWVNATVKGIVWDFYKNDIFICFDGMRPKVLSWDGVSQSSTWTLIPYQERLRSSGQKRTVFYRLSPPGIAMQPSTTSGAPTLFFDPHGLPISVGLNASFIETRMRFCGRQLIIKTIIDANTATAQVVEALPWGTTLATPSFDSGGTPTFDQIFVLDQEVIGQTSGAKGVVTFVNAALLGLQHLDLTKFKVGETIVGPDGSITFGSSTGINNPNPTVVWDDEVMNDFRGYPRSCFIDQGRLGFCDFPALPGLIVWSALGDFYDLYEDESTAAVATSAIQVVAPGKSRVLYVVPGAEGSEFVFCDNAVYYIPISAANPLKPGSVAFNTLMSEGAAQVQPRPVQQSIVYISAGFTQLKAVQAVGAYYRPYIVDDISENHVHLLNTPICIAAPGGSDQFEESYFYLANSDGSLIVCNFDIKNGVIDKASLGFVPWSGAGSATWISALKGHSDVIVSGSYMASATPVTVVEQIDATQYLDVSLLYNGTPSQTLTPPGGKGPLWWFLFGTVDVMDGLRPMGTYQVDGNGFLVPQFNAGENLASATLRVGQAWTATAEPFVPPVQGGQDVGQRLWPRRVARFQTYVYQSSGLTICKLFSGPVTRTSPAIGTVMQRRRWPAWNQDDDPTQAPPLREQAYYERPIGRSHDPRIAIIKDTPGPLTIMEILQEVSV